MTIAEWEGYLCTIPGVTQAFADDAVGQFPGHAFFFVVGGDRGQIDALIASNILAGLCWTLFHRHAPAVQPLAPRRPHLSWWRRALRWLSELGAS